MSDRTLNLKALVSGLRSRGYSASVGNLSTYSRERTGFPCTETPAGRLFNLDEVASWLDANSLCRRKSRTSVATETASDSQRLPVRALALASDPDIQALMSPGVSAVSVARAQLSLCARQFAIMATTASVISDSANESLVKVIARATEEEKKAIDNQIRLDELIPRNVVVESVADITQRVVQVCESVCTKLSQQFEIWLGDAAFMALSIEDRRRTILAWAKMQVSQIRKQESDEILAAIKAKQSAANDQEGL